jgi:hypothetical protein
MVFVKMVVSFLFFWIWVFGCVGVERRSFNVVIIGNGLMDIGDDDWAVLMRLLFGLRLWILVVIIGLF